MRERSRKPKHENPNTRGVQISDVREHPFGPTECVSINHSAQWIGSTVDRKHSGSKPSSADRYWPCNLPHECNGKCNKTLKLAPPVVCKSTYVLSRKRRFHPIEHEKWCSVRTQTNLDRHRACKAANLTRQRDRAMISIDSLIKKRKTLT